MILNTFPHFRHRTRFPKGQRRPATLPQSAVSNMPGTHLLPPNLLKLFAPRPPLPYTRPLDRDIDRVRPKDVDGVAALLARLSAEKDDAIAQGGTAADVATVEGMEEGEEPTFTLAEEVKREIRREERKKLRAQKFQTMKESCEYPATSLDPL